MLSLLKKSKDPEGTSLPPPASKLQLAAAPTAVCNATSNRETIDRYLDKANARSEMASQDYLKQPKLPVIERLIKIKQERLQALASS